MCSFAQNVLFNFCLSALRHKAGILEANFKKLGWMFGTLAAVQTKQKHTEKQLFTVSLLKVDFMLRTSVDSPLTEPNTHPRIIQMTGGKTAQIDPRNKQVKTKELMKQTLIGPSHGSVVQCSHPVFLKCFYFIILK